MMPVSLEPEIEGVYEKTRLDVQLSMLLDHIHQSLGWLSEHLRELPRRARHNIQRAIEEHVNRLLMRIHVLTPRRKSNLQQLLMHAQSLSKNPTYEEWLDYILNWIAIIEQAMDFMDLMLTPTRFIEYEWADDFYDDALEKSVVDRGGGD